MDIFDTAKRSEIMSRIRSKNTVPERIVFKHLRKSNIYFQKHYDRVPGKPDIALPRKKRAVFIDGDFWHGRHLKRLVETRDESDYWVIKIKTNITRDRQQRALLIQNGWSILSIWESDLKRHRTRSIELQKITDFINNK